MTRIGIFSRTFTADTLEEVLDIIAATGIELVHLNLVSAGVASLPQVIDDRLCDRITLAFRGRGLKLIGVSGTFNAIHPDIARRADDIGRAVRLIEAAPAMGTDFVSLCTGTRDAENMWRAHPDNHSDDAWQDLLATLERLLPFAETAGVILGIEPERGNVIATAGRAKRLLDELRSPRLGIIMDGANLFDPQHLGDMRVTLTKAFELLGPDIVQIHAKDIPRPRREGPGKVIADQGSQAAGTGLLDWDLYFDLIAASGYDGPIVLHNLTPGQVTMSRDFIQRKIHHGDTEAPRNNLF